MNACCSEEYITDPNETPWNEAHVVCLVALRNPRNVERKLLLTIVGGSSFLEIENSESSAPAERFPSFRNERIES